MTILNSLEPVIDFEVNSWALFSDFQSNLEQLLVKLNTYGTGRKEVKSFKIEEVTSDNFQINKLNGLIQNIVFKNTSPIDGQLPLISDLEQGSAFLLYNKASTPGTNTVTITLNASLEISGDTSIVLNSNSYAVLLILTDKVNSKYTKYILDSKHIDSLLTSNNTWAGSNDFFISDIENLTLGKNRLFDTGIEIGRSENTGTKAFLDFKWGSGKTKDYDIRVSNYAEYSFGLESDTKLHFITDNSEMRLNLNLIPHVNNTHAIGSSSYKWTEVWATNGTIQTSDKETKENIKETSLGLDFILALKPVSWKWKNEPSKHVERIKYKKVYDKKGNFQSLEPETVIDVIPEKKYKRLHHGFINQDIEEVLKEKNIDTNDFSGFIKDKEINERALRYDSFIAPMVKAIQEQQKMIQELKLEIEKLKNNV